MNLQDQDLFNQDFQDAIDVIQRQYEYETGVECKYLETLLPGRPGLPVSNPAPDVSAQMYEWREHSTWPHSTPDTPTATAVGLEVSHSYPAFPLERNRKGRKKLRLYEYLHEALHDASMSDTIQWADRGSGTFHFVSKNKERLAESWGKRKGNRKTMTYQKMARALRNYSRTGEIVKVRRKLTYQFNPVILQRLSSGHPANHHLNHGVREMVPHQLVPMEHGYYDAPHVDWHSWCGHYACGANYEHGFTLTSSSPAKV